MKMSILADGLTMGIIFLDADCRITRWNRWLERETASREKDILGQNLFDLFPLIEKRDKAQYITKCINTNKACFLSSYFHKFLIPINIVKDQLTIKMLQDVKIYPTPDKSGRQGCIITIEDITERIFHEKELSRINTILRGIRNVNKIMINVTSESKFFKEVCNILVRDVGYVAVSIGLIENDSYKIKASKFLGKDAEEEKELQAQLNKPDFECYISTAAIKAGESRIEQLINNNSLSNKPYRTFWEKIRCHSACAVPIILDKKVIGTVTYYSKQNYSFLLEEIKLIKEITEDIAYAISNIRKQKQQKRLHQALQISEAKYHELYENALDILVSVDAVTGNIVECNQTAMDALGYAEEEIIGRSVFEMCIPESVESVKVNVVPGILKTNDIDGEELQLQCKDGSALDVLVKVADVYDGEGNLLRGRFALRDITELKQVQKQKKKLESQFRQAQKLEAIGSLAGGIAHDFNNILVPIFGYLEMMLEEFNENDSLYDDLNHVLQGAVRARDLISQILLFSRKTEHTLKPLKIHLIVGEALTLLRASIPSTIEIIQGFDKNYGMVMADPVHIHQIIMNLCTNAFHAMEKNGGKLSVFLKTVEMTADDFVPFDIKPGPYVCLKIMDTGHGIAPDVINKIYDPYFTTKEQGKGTGLGLATTYGIVKDYGGHIDVYSEVGIGTEFKIYLPVIQSSNSKSEPNMEKDLSLLKGDKRILLIDDQEAVIKITKKLLERLGYQITAYTSSSTALEAFRETPHDFDLVLTDMTMPDMTGDKLAKELIKIRSDLPIILCTGYSNVMSEKKAQSIGIRAFLTKPASMKDYSNKIREVLDEN